VGNGIIPHITQYSKVEFSSKEIVGEHLHSDMYEIMYVEEGEGIFKIDGVEHPVKKGDCITVEPNEKHEVKVTGEVPLVLFVTGVKD
jgi:quercetin dioxygenase-like cupin family protein